MSQNEIADFYGHDHDLLDEYFQKFKQLKATDFDQAKEYFKKFKFGLKRHIAWEEEILFPLFDEKFGSNGCSPTVQMKEEHRKIEKALENLHEKIRVRDIQSVSQENDLYILLREHNDKEEMIVYPAVDRASSEAEQRAVFKKMEELPVEKYKTCCMVPLDDHKKH